MKDATPVRDLPAPDRGAWGVPGPPQPHRRDLEFVGIVALLAAALGLLAGALLGMM